MTKNDSAFPTNYHDQNCQQYCCGGFADGLTKLEWFAGMAMQGLCANEKLTTEGTDKLAERAFDLAETMLAESEKRK